MKNRKSENEKKIEKKKTMNIRRYKNKIYKRAQEIIENHYFNKLMTVMIVINTIILSLDSYPIDIYRN
jgi:hypothetical protein